MKLFNRTTIIGPILPDRQASWPQAAKAPDPGQCHPPKWSFSSRPTSDCSLISDDRRDLLKAKLGGGIRLARHPLYEHCPGLPPGSVTIESTTS